MVLETLFKDLLVTCRGSYKLFWNGYQRLSGPHFFSRHKEKIEKLSIIKIVALKTYQKCIPESVYPSFCFENTL